MILENHDSVGITCLASLLAHRLVSPSRIHFQTATTDFSQCTHLCPVVNPLVFKILHVESAT